jgi:hypothetical protein
MSLSLPLLARAILAHIGRAILAHIGRALSRESVRAVLRRRGKHCGSSKTISTYRAHAAILRDAASGGSSELVKLLGFCGW